MKNRLIRGVLLIGAAGDTSFRKSAHNRAPKMVTVADADVATSAMPSASPAIRKRARSRAPPPDLVDFIADSDEESDEKYALFERSATSATSSREATSEGNSDKDGDTVEILANRRGRCRVSTTSGAVRKTDAFKAAFACKSTHGGKLDAKASAAAEAATLHLGAHKRARREPSPSSDACGSDEEEKEVASKASSAQPLRSRHMQKRAAATTQSHAVLSRRAPGGASPACTSVAEPVPRSSRARGAAAALLSEGGSSGSGDSSGLGECAEDFSSSSSSSAVAFSDDASDGELHIVSDDDDGSLWSDGGIGSIRSADCSGGVGDDSSGKQRRRFGGDVRGGKRGKGAEFYLSVNAAMAREEESQASAPGLLLAASLGLRGLASAGGSGRRPMNPALTFDAWLRCLAAALCTRDGGRAALHETPGSDDACLWAVARKAVETPLCAARDSLAASAAWGRAAVESVYALPFFEASDLLAAADGPSGAAGDCAVCNRRGHPATWRVRMFGSAVDAAALYGESAGAAPGVRALALRASAVAAAAPASARVSRSPLSAAARVRADFWSDAILLGAHAPYAAEFAAGRFCRQRLELFSALTHFKHHALLVVGDLVRERLAQLAAEGGRRRQKGTNDNGDDSNDDNCDDDISVSPDDTSSGRGGVKGSPFSSLLKRLRARAATGSSGLLGAWPTESSAQVVARTALETAWLDGGSNSAHASAAATANAGHGAGVRGSRISGSSSSIDGDSYGAATDGLVAVAATRAPSAVAAPAATARAAYKRLHSRRLIRSLPHWGGSRAMVAPGGSPRQRQRTMFLAARVPLLRGLLAENQAHEARRAAREAARCGGGSSDVAASPRSPPMPGRIPANGALTAAAAAAACSYAGDEMPSAEPLPLPPRWRDVLPLFATSAWAREVKALSVYHDSLRATATRLYATSAAAAERAEEPLPHGWAKTIARLARAGSNLMLRFAWYLPEHRPAGSRDSSSDNDVAENRESDDDYDEDVDDDYDKDVDEDVDEDVDDDDDDDDKDDDDDGGYDIDADKVMEEHALVVEEDNTDPVQRADTGEHNGSKSAKRESRMTVSTIGNRVGSAGRSPALPVRFYHTRSPNAAAAAAVAVAAAATSSDHDIEVHGPTLGEVRAAAKAAAAAAAFAADAAATDAAASVADSSSEAEVTLGELRASR